MSKENARRFYEQIEQDEALREKLRSLLKKSDSFGFEDLVRVGGEAGHEFSADDVKALAAEVGGELSENDLQQVAGGVTLSDPSITFNQKWNAAVATLIGAAVYR